MNEDFDIDALLAHLPDIAMADALPERRPDTELDAALRSYETALPRGYLSCSQVSAYLKCGFAYEMKYVLGAATRGNTSMAFGSAIHAAADVLHKSMSAMKPVTEEQIKDAYADAHVKHFDPNLELQVGEDDEDLGAVKDRGIQMTATYRKAALGEYTPAAAKGEPPPPPLRRLYVLSSEKALRTTVTRKDNAGQPTHEPVPVIAIMDIEEPHMVRDLKVRRKLPNASEAKNSLQLALYSQVFQKPDVSLDALIRPSAKLPERVIRYETPVSDAAREHAVDIFTEVADDIRAGRFRKTSPDNWWCAEGWCSYWGSCRGKKV